MKISIQPIWYQMFQIILMVQLIYSMHNTTTVAETTENSMVYNAIQAAFIVGLFGELIFLPPIKIKQITNRIAIVWQNQFWSMTTGVVILRVVGLPSPYWSRSDPSTESHICRRVLRTNIRLPVASCKRSFVFPRRYLR